jgi:hypothetical protein
MLETKPKFHYTVLPVNISLFSASAPRNKPKQIMKCSSSLTPILPICPAALLPTNDWLVWWLVEEQPLRLPIFILSYM